MTVQLIIIVAYFALTVAIGLWSSKKAGSSEAFHGAELGVGAIVCASTGEWLGGTATTGVSEYGFIFGLSGAWYTIANGIGVMFLALCFARLYRSLNSVTVPGIIEKFFGRKARTVSGILLTIVMLAVGLSQTIAAGKLGQTLLGLDFSLTCIIFSVIFIVYTLAGGMKAVTSTNTIHIVCMYGGMILALVLALGLVGGFGGLVGGVRAVEAAESGKDYFNMFSIGGVKVSSWITASLLGACTAQAGLQPVLAAKDVKTARKACIITAVVAAPFGFFTAFLGIVAKVMSHNGTLLDSAGSLVTDGKLALSTLMYNMPPVVSGIVLASILAAILSTISPIILASGTMVTKDLYHRHINPDADDKKLLLVSRLTTAASGVICCIGAIALVDSSAILDLVYSAYALRGSLFIVVIFGILWKKTSSRAACLTMLLTAIVAVTWEVFSLITGNCPIAPWFSTTYAAVLSAVAGTVLFTLLMPSSGAELAYREDVVATYGLRKQNLSGEVDA